MDFNSIRQSRIAPASRIQRRLCIIHGLSQTLIRHVFWCQSWFCPRPFHLTYTKQVKVASTHFFHPISGLRHGLAFLARVLAAKEYLCMSPWKLWLFQSSGCKGWVGDGASLSDGLSFIDSVWRFFWNCYLQFISISLSSVTSFVPLPSLLPRKGEALSALAGFSSDERVYL